VRDAASWGEVIVLAVPYGAIGAAVDELGDAIDGTVVVDASNALAPDYQLAVGFTTSGAEELQKQVPAAKVVKAFNTVFAQHMDTGSSRCSLPVTTPARKARSRRLDAIWASMLSMRVRSSTPDGSNRSAEHPAR
jgi:predicted dinucleotide-binding enzyme